MSSPAEVPYYAGKREILEDLFGCPVSIEPGWLTVQDNRYPILEDVIVLLEPHEFPASLRDRLASLARFHGAQVSASGGIQFSFGEEWRAFPLILPDHEAEFRQYFDLVDLRDLASKRICDLGCGIGRWSYFLSDLVREVVLVDFSEAIFVARDNLRSVSNALFFLADLRTLPFRDDFADFFICLGVLHHLPVPALGELRRLSRYGPRWLVYLYYALDNRPAYYRHLLAAATLVRRLLTRIRDRRLREVITWMLGLGLYKPLVGLGSFLQAFGAGRYVPLYETYAGKSLFRIRQDVYDRFFTPIEQRFSREDILELRDTFTRIEISEGLPYWHFLCEREREDRVVAQVEAMTRERNSMTT